MSAYVEVVKEAGPYSVSFIKLLPVPAAVPGAEWGLKSVCINAWDCYSAPAYIICSVIFTEFLRNGLGKLLLDEKTYSEASLGDKWVMEPESKTCIFVLHVQFFSSFNQIVCFLCVLGSCRGKERLVIRETWVRPWALILREMTKCCATGPLWTCCLGFLVLPLLGCVTLGK